MIGQPVEHGRLANTARPLPVGRRHIDTGVKECADGRLVLADNHDGELYSRYTAEALFGADGLSAG